MLRFLSSLFKGEAPGTAAPAKHLGIDLRSIDQALIEKEGYPRPQWDVIRAWIKSNVPADDVPIAWNEVGLSWLLALKSHLAPPYLVLQSPNFWLLTARPQAGGFGGVFLRKGYRHIALPPSLALQNTLIHELMHNRLAHLPSPTWLSEGLAVTVERRIGGNKSGLLDRELHQKHATLDTTNHWSILYRPTIL
jgi:hypothetical protein